MVSKSQLKKLHKIWQREIYKHADAEARAVSTSESNAKDLFSSTSMDVNRTVESSPESSIINCVFFLHVHDIYIYIIHIEIHGS